MLLLVKNTSDFESFERHSTAIPDTHPTVDIVKTNGFHLHEDTGRMGGVGGRGS